MIKWIGALLVSMCCGWFGFSMAAAHKKEELALRQLVAALDYMQCELQCRLTPLPELCLQAGKFCEKNAVGKFFHILSKELAQQVCPDVQPCVHAALAATPGIPPICGKCILELSKSMGSFDLDGQVSSLESARVQCRQELSQLCAGKEEQRRSYQTLGVCAGAALVILFI